MKKILLSVAVVALVLAPSMAFAAKTSLMGAQFYNWHLSGDVMPMPPYGSLDIPGPADASKLIVNQPSGKVGLNMTGVMNGLNPDTEYTVYLSNVYTPAEFTGWTVTGNYGINVNYLGVDYPENLVLAQSGTNITGTSLALVGGGSPWTINTGSVTGTSVYFEGYFNSNPTMKVYFSGTIATNGTMSGTWGDLAPGTRTGTWATTTGHATRNYTVYSSWPGLLSGQVPFTFVTDSMGSGSWHVNFKGTLPTSFSAWINGGGATILISDNVTL